MGDREQNSGRYYQNLLVWERADEFVKLVYKVTIKFPQDERYGVVSQFRRASLSVVLNIVEGQARDSRAELRRFCIIARASLSECTYLMDISKDLGYLDDEMYNQLEGKRRTVAALLAKLIKSHSKIA